MEIFRRKRREEGIDLEIKGKTELANLFYKTFYTIIITPINKLVIL